jgi:hypothetical protein
MTMPRTAHFFETREAAFGDNTECAISHDDLDAIQGGILQVDGSKCAYACDALLGWYDLRGTNPLTRERLAIRAVHPVLTPETHLADYTHAVRELAMRRWDRVEEVDADMLALHLRQTNKKRDRDDDAARSEPCALIREAQRAPEWWIFSHSADKRAAMRALDRRLVGEALHLSDSYAEIAVCFLQHRRRLWRFPPEEQTFPIYMDVDALIEDIMAICDYLNPIRIAHAIENAAEGCEYRFEYMDLGATMQRTIVLYGPNALEWILGVVLPAELETLREWWRTPHSLTTIIRHLFSIGFDAFVDFYYDVETTSRALRSFMTPSDESWFSHPDPDAQPSDGQWPALDWLLSDVIPHRTSEPNHEELKTADTLARDLKREHGDACPFSEEALRDAIPRAFVPITAYTFDPEEPLQTDVTLLPSDPYANPRLLRALEYGLRCLDAEAL